MSSPLPQARGNVWERVPVPQTQFLPRTAAVCRVSTVSGSEDGDSVFPGRDVSARGPFRGLSVFLIS